MSEGRRWSPPGRPGWEPRERQGGLGSGMQREAGVGTGVRREAGK